MTVSLASSPLEALISRARLRPPLVVAVVHPTDALSLGAALEARRQGLADPILVGPGPLVRAAALALGEDLSEVRLVDAADERAAASRAVELVRDGEAGALMKGRIHTDELLRAVLDRDAGLRTGRRLTHVFVCCLPADGYPKLLLVTDAVVNIAPDLETKRHIVQNAIDLARVLGIETPKVALLAAAETVSPAMPATVDAAALSKMAERGQIRGGVVDGPLALDSAVSTRSARVKGISSPVAGDPDVLVVPNVEAGNILFKTLGHFAGAVTPGVVLGASAPVLLTSRSDPSSARIASCALAALLVADRRQAMAEAKSLGERAT